MDYWMGKGLWGNLHRRVGPRSLLLSVLPWAPHWFLCLSYPIPAGGGTTLQCDTWVQVFLPWHNTAAAVRRPEATTSVVEVTAYPARLLPSITWAEPSTNNSNSAFSMGVSAISLVAAYVSVTQSWVISPSSSNTNSVIADIIHEDGFLTGARCITIFGAVRVANQFPQREEVTEVTFAWLMSADTAWGHLMFTVCLNTISFIYKESFSFVVHYWGN